MVPVHTRQQDRGDAGGSEGDEELADEEHVVADKVEGGNAEEVSPHELERSAGGRHEVVAPDGNPDVALLVDLVAAALDALEAAVNAAENGSLYFVVLFLHL